MMKMPEENNHGLVAQAMRRKRKKWFHVARQFTAHHIILTRYRSLSAQQYQLSMLIIHKMIDIDNGFILFSYG